MVKKKTAKKNIGKKKKKTRKKKEQRDKKESKKVPPWALQPFKDSMERIRETNQVLTLAIKGIYGLRGIPKIVKVIAEVESEDGTLDQDDIKKLKLAKEEADLAQREVDKDFPLLHAQALISLWGIIESLVHTFLATWLMRNSKVKEIEALKKVKVSIADFEAMDSQERNYYIVQTLEQQIAAPYKKGISRFEALLDIFNLSGAVDDQVRRDILELQQIRHVLVHRHGVIDKKLKDTCPWIRLKVGSRVSVSHKDMTRYFSAVDRYVAELVRRVAHYFGKDIDI